ncbi:MAG TPA: PPC domain-containing DNA-binding protein [Candidatus Eremiobacteraceae bacterium]|nr:PPC domain-containing DNA-binding protein [Candidatus Eremiobacteraceae bacterium]
MRYAQIADGATKTYALVLATDDEAVSEITAFAKLENVTAARLTGIGGFSQATLGYFDRDKKQYQPFPVPEQVEVLSLVGDIALRDGAPLLHAHALVGHRDGSVTGGHLIMGRVWPTLELFVDVYSYRLQKLPDADVGIAILDLSV